MRIFSKHLPLNLARGLAILLGTTIIVVPALISAEFIPQRNTNRSLNAGEFHPPRDESHPDKTISGGSRGRPLPQKIEFRPPRDKSHPDKTVSGGSRGPLCPQDKPLDSESDPPLIRAIAPDSIAKLTTSARPTFWVALPETQAKEIIFSVISDTNTYHAGIRYPITQSPALLGLNLPKNAPDLAIDNTYRWAVSVVCGDASDPLNDPGLVLSVKRVTSVLPSAPQSPEQQAIVASQNGHWYDAVSALLRPDTDPTQTQPLWQQLLESVNLGSIAQDYGPAKGNVVLYSDVNGSEF